MRTPAAATLPPRATGLAALAFALAFAGTLACFDAPPAGPATPFAAIDPALPVVVAGAALVGSPVGGGRPSAALQSTQSMQSAGGAGGRVEVLAVTDLGERAGGPEVGSVALDVNRAGQAVGWIARPGERERAALWEPAGRVTELISLRPDLHTEATAINAAGQVVGVTFERDEEFPEFPEFGPALLWDTDRAPKRLLSLGAIYDINDAGEIVGVGVEGAVRGTLAGGFTQLPSLSERGSQALAINAVGQIVGTNGSFEGLKPVLWDADGQLIDLGTSGYPFGEARSVNNAGQVVGRWCCGEPRTGNRAFVWERGAGLREIGPGIAYGINTAGHVVGATNFFEFQAARAFFWSAQTGIIELPGLPGSTGSAAFAINDASQVVGASRLSSGRTHATLWAVRVSVEGAPVVDRLAAAVLPPGVIPGLSGVWLRVRLADPGDPGPWDWRIDWGDGPGGVTALDDLPRTGEFAFLRRKPYATGGPHAITVTATDQSGLTSTPATAVVSAP